MWGDAKFVIIIKVLIDKAIGLSAFGEYIDKPVWPQRLSYMMRILAVGQLPRDCAYARQSLLVVSTRALNLQPSFDRLRIAAPMDL